MMIAGGFASAVIEMCRVLGLSCRWLDGTVRQQCVGHLPFERQARANGGFSVRRTGSIDPIRPVSSLLSGRSAKSRLCELELYKAAVGDLTQSATTGPQFSLVAVIRKAGSFRNLPDELPMKEACPATLNDDKQDVTSVIPATRPPTYV